MWLKFVYMVLIASGALAKQDELLDSLYGLEGRNKVSICVATRSGQWRRCDAALYNRECAIVRARCLAAAHTHQLRAERPSAGGSCHTGDGGLQSSRGVQHHVMHPWFDLAIVIMRTPYYNLDQLANATEIRLKLRRHGVYKWMKHYFDASALLRSKHHHFLTIPKNFKTYHHPIWYFFVTMVLPTVLFMLFYIYVIFYTGQSQKVPYKKQHYSKKITNV